MEQRIQYWLSGEVTCGSVIRECLGEDVAFDKRDDNGPAKQRSEEGCSEQEREADVNAWGEEEHSIVDNDRGEASVAVE